MHLYISTRKIILTCQQSQHSFRYNKPFSLPCKPQTLDINISNIFCLLVYEKMRNRMERLVVLPAFSIGCVSHASVAVVDTNQSKKSKSESSTTVTRRQEGDESSSGVNMKNSRGNFLALPKPNISNGIHRLIRSFRNFSQLFVYKEEMEEMEEMEMEIGLPTDVKHVTHIGWDGSTTTNPVKGWENLKTPEILSFPTISLMQFELAMASQADQPQPLGVNTSKFT
ncbi:CRIB domain-containing protein RIC4-like isoform X1 [Cornus florida]|uniref:CRIB domain-containing protein RIC4-like isoform X1 n=1 Tax=Cornus florida TaxID=4283 RepID=UPI002898778E|nr:CRIB domain-containing protein RIC4-like isoform X1 [Cornus florida]